MKIQITAGGIHDGEGNEITVGTTFELTTEPTAWAGRYTILSEGGEDRNLTVNPAQDAPTGGPPYAVKEASPGWYQIVDAAGVEVGKKLRKDDAEAFKALSAEDQAEFLKGEA